jgi:hypothetical protein
MISPYLAFTHAVDSALRDAAGELNRPRDRRRRRRAAARARSDRRA